MTRRLASVLLAILASAAPSSAAKLFFDDFEPASLLWDESVGAGPWTDAGGVYGSTFAAPTFSVP